MSRARNLVLVTVDSLRVDHLGYAGYLVPTSPVLDRLSEENVVYSHAIASGVPTYYSFPAVHAGRPPLALGREILGLAPGEPTLASRLRDVGFTTGAFVATNPYLNRQLHFDQGFDRFDDSFASTGPLASPRSMHGKRPTERSRLGKLNSTVAFFSRRWALLRRLHAELYFQYAWRARARRSSEQIESQRKYPGAEEVIHRAIEWIEGHPPEPFFVWVHLMDPHYPYYPPANALRAIGRGDLAEAARAVYLNGLWNRDDVDRRRLLRVRDSVMALYDASIRWADEQIGKLVTCLEKRGSWNRSIFALTADHGEQFLERDERYHAPSNLSQALLAVPLVLHAPGLTPAIVEDPTSLVDLVPTVFHLLGTAIPGDLRDRSPWTLQASDRSARDLIVVSEAIVDCLNPWEKTQRLQPRLLAAQGRSYKVEINFATSKETYSRVGHWSREEMIDANDCPPRERRRLLAAALEHVDRRRSPEMEKRRLAARLRELGRELASRNA